MNKRLDLESGGKSEGGDGLNLNHIAGAPSQGVQRCQRCGTVLIDNRGVNVPTGSKGPRFFEDGGPVYKSLRTVGAFKEQTAPLCSVK
jgi:hypothetical protein